MQPVRIKQESKCSCSSKRLGTEFSMSKLSIEDYHGAASLAVPFDWESQPGTPKVKYYRDPRLPPLTPPPASFHSLPPPKRPTYTKNLFHSIFPARARKKAPLQLSPVSCSFTSSSFSSLSGSSSPWSRSAYSVPSSPMIRPTHSKWFDWRATEEEAEYGSSSSPVSTLCFRGGRISCCSSCFKLPLRDV